MWRLKEALFPEFENAMKRIYLAGPDVFFPDHAQRFARYKSACAAAGLQGCSPLDNTMADCQDRPTLARKIYLANVALIEQCDGVLANLAPFRGTEPDSGTVFEVGYAVALGKPVAAWGISSAIGYRTSVQQLLGLASGAVRDPTGAEIEDFGLKLNLMLACSCELANTVEEAVQLLLSRVTGRDADATSSPPVANARKPGGSASME